MAHAHDRIADHPKSPDDWYPKTDAMWPPGLQARLVAGMDADEAFAVTKKELGDRWWLYVAPDDDDKAEAEAAIARLRAAQAAESGRDADAS